MRIVTHPINFVNAIGGLCKFYHVKLRAGVSLAWKKFFGFLFH